MKQGIKSIFLISITFLTINILYGQNCESEWAYGISGLSPGFRFLHAEDFDNDGVTEILVNAGGGSGFWYILEYDASTNSYYQTFLSKPYVQNRVWLMKVLDIDEDGHKEIFIGTESGTIEVYNADNLELITDFDLPSSYLRNLDYIDVDNDGEKEIFAASSSKVFFLNAQTFEIEHQFSVESGNAIAGQVDEDDLIEIIFSDGQIREYANGTLTTQWDAFEGFNSTNYRDIELINVDEDSAMEVMFLNGRSIEIYDIADQALKYSDSDPSKNFVFGQVVDYDNDNTEEIIVGMSRGDMVKYELDLTNKELLIDGFEDDIYAYCGLYVADTNNDDWKKEVVFADGCGSSGTDLIRVYELPSGNLKWKTREINGPFTAIEPHDTNNDGIKEILAVSSARDARGLGSTLVILNSANGREVKKDFNLFGEHSRVHFLEKNQLTELGETRFIAIGAEQLEGAAIWVFDNNLNLINSHVESEVWGFISIEIADLDLDGDMEILTGTSGGDVYIYDHNLNLIEQNFMSWGSDVVRSLKAINIDEDPKLEYVGINDRFFVFDDNFQQIYLSEETSYTAMEVGDWDGNGVVDIILGGEYGDVTIMSVDDYVVFESFDIGTDEVSAIRLVGNVGTGTSALFIFAEGTLYTYQKVEETPVLKEVGFKGRNIGEFDSLVFEDLNDDGIQEIITGSNYAVKMLTNDCTLIATTAVTPTPDKEENVSIFPNPTTNDITIKLLNESDDIQKATVFDHTGRMLDSYENQDVIRLSDYPSGMYFLLIETSSGSLIIEKVIKQAQK